MKTAAPTIIQIENEQDVQTYRDATGEVLNVGETIVKGMINSTPTGIRRFPSLELALAYFGETMGAKPKASARVKPRALTSAEAERGRKEVIRKAAKKREVKAKAKKNK